MLGEMRLRDTLTSEQRDEYRRKWVEELETYKISTSQITSLEKVIYLLEENASDINDVMQDKDVNGHYSPQLQAVFDDTMDILDYLKNLNSKT